MTPYEKQKLFEEYQSRRNLAYSPLLKQFVTDNKEILIQSGYPWAPFIPYAFPSYGFSGKKVFYIGIDTYYWGTYPVDLFNGQILDNFEYLLRKNDDVVTTRRILLDWAYDKGTFWKFICKLQLYIQTGRLYSTEDLRKLSLDEICHIDSMGYGNLNSIELNNTLSDEGYWVNMNHEAYWAMKQASASLDELKPILDAYNPDYVIVLSSNIDESKFFNGLKYIHLEQHDEDCFRVLYNIEDYNTKIIQTCHPRRFSFKSTNDDEMVPYIADSLKLFDE